MRNVAFLIIHTKKHENFNNEEIRSNRGSVNIPLMLMINRWDGKIGFPGGNINENETIKDGLLREVREEIGLTLVPNQISKIEEFTFQDKKVHLFVIQTDHYSMKEIIRNSTYCDSFLKENQGCFAVQMTDFNDESTRFQTVGFTDFLKNSNFAGSGRIEVEIFTRYLF